MYERQKAATFETNVENGQNIAKLGNLAIRRHEHLGINDPLTHVYSYLERGESAMVGIREDIETDIAERLPNAAFLNTVNFISANDDFISIYEKSSMRRMTENNLYTMQGIKTVNPDFDNLEIDRAKIEVAEISKINEWFKSAAVGSYLIFESLPINNQTIAVSRIYQKVSKNGLDGNYISLHNPTINRINDLRLNFGAGSASNELEILANGYEYNNDDKNILNNFIVQYVNKYDEILFKETGKQHSYGIVKDNGMISENCIDKIRKQKKLTDIYLNTIRDISNNNGLVGESIIRIADKLGIKNTLSVNQPFSIEKIRSLLNEVIYSLTSAIDRADETVLKNIESGSADYSAVSIYASQAKADGVNYDSQACPEYTANNQAGTNESETRKIQKAYSLLPNDSFGVGSIGVCVVENCPSRGEVKWNPRPTFVGSCSVCVDCHKMFGVGKNPTEQYKNRSKIKQSA